MTGNKPRIEEQYKRGNDIINYVVYQSTSGLGDDEVLQHKLMGTSETAHITVHPDGTINFRIKRSRAYLDNIVKSGLAGFSPTPSKGLLVLLQKLQSHIRAATR